MFTTIITACHLLWLSANNTSLKLKLLSGIGLGIGQGISAFFAPFFLSRMIQAISDNNQVLVINSFYWLVFWAVFVCIIRYLWRYHCEVISRVLPLNLKEIYYEKIFNRPYYWHLENSVGYFSSALDKVCQVLALWIWKAPFDYFSSMIMAICFFIYTATISMNLFLYFFINFFIMCVIIRILYSKRMVLLNESSRAIISFDKSYIDMLYNVRSVKKMNLLSFVKQILGKKNKFSESKARQMMHYNALQYGFVEVYLNAMFLFPIAYYIYNYMHGSKGLEIIVMIASIHPKVGELGRQYMALLMDIAKTKTEHKILAEHLGDIFETQSQETARKNWKTITFKNTKFEFVRDNCIFSHQVEDFTIHKGDHIAITGKSGEGKSTFLNLLTRQFMADSGAISVDNINYKNVPEDFFNNNITYVSQDVELFDMTFYDNIVMGKKINKEHLNKVLEGCCLTELIERMNGNLYTDIGEKGIKISGGERQRINLARGLLLNRSILVLDEITANLDPLTTEKIWQFVFSEYKDKTIIAVSHEKTLLNFVDRKLEFKKGKGKEI